MIYKNIILNSVDKIFEKSKNQSIYLNKIQLKIDNAFEISLQRIINNVSYLEKRNGLNHEIVRSSEMCNEWEAIFSSLYCGLDNTKNLIFKGFYLQATSLVRQQLESLGRLKQIECNQRNGKDTGIGHLDKNDKLKKQYDFLSKTAHLNTHGIVEESIPTFPMFEDPIAVLPHGSSVAPVYNEAFFIYLYKIHIRIQIRMIRAIDYHIKYRIDQNA